MTIVIYLVVGLFFIVLFIVGIFNNAEVTVNLILWQVGPAPLGTVIAAAAIFGVAFSCVIGVIDGIKIRIQNRKLRKQMRRLEEDSDSLRLKLARHESPDPAAHSADQATPWGTAPPERAED